MSTLRALTMPKWGIEMVEGTVSDWSIAQTSFPESPRIPAYTDPIAPAPTIAIFIGARGLDVGHADKLDPSPQRMISAVPASVPDSRTRFVCRWRPL